MQPLPFDQMINPKTGRMQPRKVDVDSEAYECARHYMIRLERAGLGEPAQPLRVLKIGTLQPHHVVPPTLVSLATYIHLPGLHKARLGIDPLIEWQGRHP